ncbi:hypothetical protein BC833DRAFT_623706 [Globomyces pollinis-pini]|nr:hypothetical protein BC833DRAFT_623706 [Globomyces pollinis-pini]
MKRDRDDDTDMDKPKQDNQFHDEQYMIYARSRLRDNCVAFAPTNPARYQNMLFELAYQLSLTKDIRNQSLQYILTIPDRLSSIPNIQTLFIYGIAAIWTAQKSNNTFLFNISTLLNRIPSLSGVISPKGHMIYNSGYLNLVLEEFENVITIISSQFPQQSTLYQLKNTKMFYNETCQIYKFYKDLFQALIRFTNDEYENVEAAKISLTPTLDIFRYGWLLVIYCRAKYDQPNSNLEDLYILVIYCILYVASHINDRLHQSLESVINCIRSGMKTDFDISKFDKSKMSQLWKTELELFLHHLPTWICVNVERFYALRNPFLLFVDHFKHSGFLISEPPTTVYPFPWKINNGALDGDVKGLLHTNMQKLNTEIDKHFRKLQCDIDIVAFVPSWDRCIATPRKYIRTPCKSIASRSTVRNLFKIQQGCKKYPSMVATPLSLKTHAYESQCSESAGKFLQMTFMNQKISQDLLDGIHITIQDRVNRIIETITVQKPQSEPLWDLARKIYYHFMLRFVSKYSTSNVEAEAIQKLTVDSQYHRTILCISIEIVRYSFQSMTNYLTFEKILQLTEVNAIDLFLMLRLVTDVTGNWPRELVKKLFGIQERIIAIDTWCDSNFQLFLQLAKLEAPISQTSINTSQVLKLYGKLHTVSTLKMERYIYKYQALHLESRFDGYMYLYNNVLTLCHDRLDKFGNDENINMTSICQEKAFNIIVYCIENEYHLKLISNRHIDVILLCSIVVASILNNIGPSIGFHELISQYRKHPHFIESTITEVLMPNNTVSDLMGFYESVFVPSIDSKFPCAHVKVSSTTNQIYSAKRIKCGLSRV